MSKLPLVVLLCVGVNFKPALASAKVMNSPSTIELTPSCRKSRPFWMFEIWKLVTSVLSAAFRLITSPEVDCVFTVVVALVTDGVSGTPVMLMVNVCGAEVFTPPLSVLPLSISTTVIWAEPKAFGAEVKVSVPLESIAGAELNNPGFVLFVTLNVKVCPDSSGGPGEMVFAKPGIVCGPASSAAEALAEIRKDGASLTGFTVTLTSASSESSPAPALTRYLKRSGPLKFGFGA